MMLMFDLVSQLKMVDPWIILTRRGGLLSRPLPDGWSDVDQNCHSHPNLLNDQGSSFQTPGRQHLECELHSPRCEEQLPEKF